MCVSSVVGSEDNNASTLTFPLANQAPVMREAIRGIRGKRQPQIFSPQVSSDEIPKSETESDFVTACVASRGNSNPKTANHGLAAFFAKISSNRGIFLSLFRRFFRPSKRRTRRRITDARDRGDRSNRAQEVIQIPALIAPPP